MPIGAITYPPVALDLNTKVWPTFPWGQVAQLSDAILPMAYWRYDTHTPVGAAWYTAGNLIALRILTGEPNLVVHIVGLVPASDGRGHGLRAPGRRGTVRRGSACTRRSPSRAASGRCSPARQRRFPAPDRARACARSRCARAPRCWRPAVVGGGAIDQVVPGPPIVTRPIGVGPGFRLPPRGAAAAAGVPIGAAPCRPGALAGPVVAHLEIFARRDTLIIPAGIGVRRGTLPLPAADATPTGVIVAGRPGLTLGDLFAIWGQPLARGPDRRLHRRDRRVRRRPPGARRRPADPDTPSFPDRDRGLGLRATARPLRLPPAT